MSLKPKFLRPVVKVHGGKRYLYPWIIEHFPENYQQYHYIEPFIGGASVFLNKLPANEGLQEVINDLDLGAVQIYRALRDEPDHFIKALKRITYSENVFKRELKRQGGEYKDYMDHAISEFVVRRMSRGGMKGAFAWSDRLRGGIPGDINAWKTILQMLPHISQRVKRATIVHRDALSVISAFDSTDVLCYADPPYLHETRVSPDAYEFEMTTDQHIALAEELLKFRGKVIVSGYPSQLYNRLFADWRCVKKQIANHASQQKSKKIKTECLWLNY